jgi:hypothetical protein
MSFLDVGQAGNTKERRFVVRRKGRVVAATMPRRPSFRPPRMPFRAMLNGMLAAGPIEAPMSGPARLVRAGSTAAVGIRRNPYILAAPDVSPAMPQDPYPRMVPAAAAILAPAPPRRDITGHAYYTRV